MSEAGNGQLLSGGLVKGGLRQRSSQPGPRVLLVAALRLGRAQDGLHRRVDLVGELAGEVAQAPGELAVEPAGLEAAPANGEDAARAQPELVSAHARVAVGEMLHGDPEVGVVEGLRHAEPRASERARERERKRMEEREWSGEWMGGGDIIRRVSLQWGGRTGEMMRDPAKEKEKDEREREWGTEGGREGERARERWRR